MAFFASPAVVAIGHPMFLLSTWHLPLPSTTWLALRVGIVLPENVPLQARPDGNCKAIPPDDIPGRVVGGGARRHGERPAFLNHPLWDGHAPIEDKLWAGRTHVLRDEPPHRRLGQDLPCDVHTVLVQ